MRTSLAPERCASMARYQMDRGQRLSSSWYESNPTERVGKASQRLTNAGVNLGKRHRNESNNRPAAFSHAHLRWFNAGS